MRILVLSHRIPYPPNKGDKIRAFNIIEHLRQRHEVLLATLIDDRADVVAVPELQSRISRLLYARIDQSGRKLLALRAMLKSGSITVTHFYSRRLQREVDNLLDSSDVGMVFCLSSPMAEYVFRSRHLHGKLAGTRLIMDLIDVDSHKWHQYAQRAPFWLAWVYRYEARALSAYELRIAARFHRIYVVSEQERTFFPPGGSDGKLRALANGVDLKFFAPTARAPERRPVLVFVGVMNYWPNVEGVTWFVDEVFPRVQAEVPDARLLIVGSRPDRSIRQLERVKGVTVTGFVEDVRDYVAAADVCIAPLLIARGIQNKVLEAMAMGKAVVATSQAYEGLQAAEGEEIVVADGANGFAAAVVALLRDPNRAGHIGRLARLRMESSYTWDGNLARLAEEGL